MPFEALMAEEQTLLPGKLFSNTMGIPSNCLYRGETIRSGDAWYSERGHNGHYSAITPKFFVI
jgi:hypothetical protein